MSAELATVYDTVVYPSRSCPQAHPDRMATLAKLFGMSPASVENCRFLELGCGDGHNLLALAFALPGSTFVGIDLAPSAIAKANDEAQALELVNVEFHCANLLDWSGPGEPFDYVIAHGLVSWVPEAVCRRVFELCRDRLASHGVAYISYNALPGWHVRGMLRQMMLFHTRHLTDPAQKIAQAKEFLRLMLAGHAAEGAPAALLKREAQWILDRGADEILFHDDLAEINRPFYFHEFAALAGQHGLQFLAEAEFAEMQESIHPPPVVEALRQLDANIVLKEQYLDFLKCRRFRQTLLCRADVPLNRALTPGIVRRFLIASEAEPKSVHPDLRHGAVEGFVSRGVTMNVDDPVTKAAMLELRAVWPRALRFDELVRAARRRLGLPTEDDADGDQLAEALLTAYAAAVVELHVFQAPWSVKRGGRAILSPLARMQLAQGRVVVTSLRHTDTDVSTPAMQAVLLLLDGSRDVPAIVAELGRRIDAGELALPDQAARETLTDDVARAVRDAASSGLLIGWDEVVAG